MDDVLAPGSQWILAGVQEYLHEAVGIKRTAQPEDKILDDLGLEGLEIPDFILELEERFGIEVPDSDVGKILNGTIGEAVEYVRVRLDAPIAS